MTEKGERALWLWKEGYTYVAIARMLGLSNAGAAERLVSEQRSEELGLPSPYENPVPARKSA